MLVTDKRGDYGAWAPVTQCERKKTSSMEDYLKSLRRNPEVLQRYRVFRMNLALNETVILDRVIYLTIS